MMPARPYATSPASDGLLIVGVAALLCGLSLVAGGLSSDENTVRMAGQVALDVPITQVDHGTLQPLASPCPCEDATSRAEDAPAGTTIQTLVHGPALVFAPQRSRERFVGDGLGWSVPTTSGDRRSYLLKSAAARWNRALQPTDDSSADGALEAKEAS